MVNHVVQLKQITVFDVRVYVFWYPDQSDVVLSVQPTICHSARLRGSVQ